MSEIKGQLLGIVLVIMIFSAISTVLVTAFTNMGNRVADQITEELADADMN